MKKKQFRSLYLTLFSLFFVAIATHASYGQCSIDYDLSLDPPIPVSGAYPSGTTIELCYSVNSLGLSGGGWLSGMGIDFPEGWDLSSIEVVIPPEACANGGTWIFFEDLNCNGIDLPPGFYYDVNAGGPEDGNPCNNYGDPCFTNANWQFCIEATLDTVCADQGNLPVTPGLMIFGDGDIGAWSSNTQCFLDGTNVFLPEGIEFEMTCCDANPGGSPGVIPICENGDICLFDQLLGSPDPDGVWTGPSGWATDGTDCGTFDPLNDPPGEYIYTVAGTDGCLNSSSIVMEYTDLGIVQSVAYCESSPVCLNGWMPIEDPGQWYGPDGNPIDGCTIDPLADPDGVYTYEFYDDNSCLTTASLDIEFGTFYSGGEYTEYSLCDSDSSFTPFEVMNGNPDEGGQWVLYEANDSFVSFFPDWDFSLSIEYLQENLDDPSNFYLVYLLGFEPCPPSFDTLMVTLADCSCPAFAQWSAESDTICLGESYDLQIGLEGQPPFDVIYEVNGLEVVLTGISDGFTLNLSPDETTSYTLLSVSDANCITALNQTFTLTVSESGDCCPEISVQFLTPDTTLCANDEICVQAEITGGTPPYFFSYLDVNNSVVIPVTNYFSGDCIEQIENESNTYVIDFFYSDANNCSNAIPPDTLQIITDPDTDGDGICDSDEIVGCQDPNAPNYNPFATDPGPCEIDGGLSEDEWELSEIQMPFGDPDYDWTGIQIDDFDNTSWDFIIYPNPSPNGTFQIAIRGNTTPSSVEIYAADGRLIHSENILTHSSLNEIHLDLSNGLYNVLLRTPSGSKTHKLLIKQ